MNIFYFILPILLIILISIYLFYFIARALRNVNINIEKKSTKLTIIVLTLIIMYFSLRDFGVGLIVLIHIIVIVLLMDLINYSLKLITRRNKRGVNKWTRIYESGMIPIILSAIILVYGYWNMAHIVETDYKIHTNKKIREKGYRVAMISDLHYGTVMNKEKLQDVCRDIESKNPDIVVLCGDIVDEKTDLNQMKEAIEVLGDIKSEYGVFYIYGNHDDAQYLSIPSYTKEELENQLILNGIHVLADESYDINDDLVIIGRQDEGFSKEEERKSGEELLTGIDTNKFSLLLDHQPSELKENSALGYDLQLSGHTHRGQIWPIGLIDKVFKFNELEYGYKKIGDYQIIVSSGISGWNYPIRTGSNSEYVIIDIIK